jgi:hypothetical protein
MDPGQCPTCRARFRGARVCSRCGADLTAVMLLAARAWHLRQTARAAMAVSDGGRAVEAATIAEQTQHCRSGAFLVAIARWLTEQKRDDSGSYYNHPNLCGDEPARNE